MDLMDNLNHNHVFGVVTAYMIVKESQKRGLPHSPHFTRLWNNAGREMYKEETVMNVEGYPLYQREKKKER